MKDYLQQAALTAPKQIIGEIPSTLVLDCLKDIIGQGNKLDRLKKNMFYGKELNGDVPEELRGHTPLPVSRLPTLLLGLPSEHAAVEVIHGVVGAITETVELAEALVAALESGIAIDVVNLAEECGDVIWYLACILRHGGKDFPDLMEQNIAKLRKRYPDGFTTYDALNRNLTEERRVLEQSQAQGKYGALVDENDQPVPKAVVNLRDAVLLTGMLVGEGPKVGLRLAGDAEGHPEHGDNPVRTSRIVKFDEASNTYETRNTVYKVISWAM